MCVCVCRHALALERETWREIARLLSVHWWYAIKIRVKGIQFVCLFTIHLILLSFPVSFLTHPPYLRLCACVCMCVYGVCVYGVCVCMVCMCVYGVCVCVCHLHVGTSMRERPIGRWQGSFDCGTRKKGWDVMNQFESFTSGSNSYKSAPSSVANLYRIDAYS